MKQLMVMILLLSSFNLKAADPFNEPMRFYEGWDGGNVGESVWIAAIGVIEKDTAEKFKAFIKEKQPGGYQVLLHSPGGNLIAGIQLGYEIRKLAFNTFVAKSINNPESMPPSGDTPHNDFAPGECSGACAYAFLGGKKRVIISDAGTFYNKMKGSKLGFPPLYMTTAANTTERCSNKKDTANTQRVIEKMVEYIFAMGINPRLLERLTKDKQIIYPTYSELEAWNIINPQSFTNWVAEPYKKGLVIAAKNINSTTNQVRQITALCKLDPKKPELLLTTEVVDFDNEDYIDSEQAVFLTNGEYETYISGDNVQLRKTEETAYFSITLEETIFRKLFDGNNFYIQLRLPRVAGDFWADVKITKKDRQFFKLLLKNCIE